MITINDITKKFQDIYYLPDATPLRMIIATVLSPYMDGSPVWLMIVATSGSGKTELLKVLNTIKAVSQISNMSENTLLSGSRKPKTAVGEKEAKETSLLKRIPKRGGALIWPEFNTLLDERSEKKAAILSQLRAVYDGQLVKMTGLGDTISWEGKIAVIGACTEKYFTDMEYLDAAGPRFTIYTLPEMNDEQSKLRLAKVKKNEHLFEKTQMELQDMVKAFYDRKVKEGIPPFLDVPEEFDLIINEIAMMLGVSLTAVIRDYRGALKDVYGKVDGTRFYRQARKLAQAMMVSQEDLLLIEADQDAIVKLMFDTIPRRRHRVLSICAQYEETNTKGLAHHIHLPTETVREILQELNAIGMVTRRTGDSMLGDLWAVKPKYRELFTSYEKGVEWKGGNLIHQGEEDEYDNSESRQLPSLNAFASEYSDDPTYQAEVRANKEIADENSFNEYHKLLSGEE